MFDHLHRLFSIYIRLRDTDEYGNGYCHCGQSVTFKTADCGHYFSRKHHILAFDERNAHIECIECNRFQTQEIRPKSFKHLLLMKYGEIIFEEMDKLSHQNCKLMKYEIDGLCRIFYKKCQELLKNKMFNTKI